MQAFYCDVEVALVPEAVVASVVVATSVVVLAGAVLVVRSPLWARWRSLNSASRGLGWCWCRCGLLRDRGKGVRVAC